LQHYSALEPDYFGFVFSYSDLFTVLGKIKDFLGVMAKANEKLELSAQV